MGTPDEDTIKELKLEIEELKNTNEKLVNEVLDYEKQALHRKEYAKNDVYTKK